MTRGRDRDDRSATSSTQRLASRQGSPDLTDLSDAEEEDDQDDEDQDENENEEGDESISVALVQTNPNGEAPNGTAE